ncbi:MAG: metal-dependent hydrolase [Terriglobales bacterium]
MEPLTHFLTGAAISRASGLNKRTLYATVTCVLAAEAADLDMVAYFRGPITGFAHHRGITHTFIGVPFVAAFVVGLVYVAWRWGGRRAAQRAPSPAPASDKIAVVDPAKTPRWGLLYGFAVICGLSHVLLDFTNNYGVRPFEPFSYKWYSWDIVFIYEPLLYVFLIGGLLLPSLFALINDEIGARRRGPRGQGGAIVALVLMLLLWGVRDYQHRRAIAALNARLYHGEDPVRVSAYPYILNPFRWYGVVECDDFFVQANVDSLTPEVAPGGRETTRFKREETPPDLAAKDSRLGHVYLDWAQYPMTEVERTTNPSGYLVRFYDLRYDYPDTRQDRKVLSARVELDDKLDVTAMFFGTRQQRPDFFSTTDKR